MNAGRAIAVIFAGLMPLAALLAADPAGDRFLEENVRSVLAKNCYACHSQQSPKAQGRLRVDSENSILAGGNAGPLITPGRPERSLLMRVLSHEGAVKMLPTGKPAAGDVALIERWIRMGAPMPTAVDPANLTKLGEARHWAFVPPGRPEPPAKISAWALTSIDRFVEGRLQTEGLAPSAEADRRTLIRRAYFDLIGIHPRTERPTRAAFPSPFEFQRHGKSWTQVSELFSKVGEHVDDLCVIRSMHTDVPNHGPSLMMMNSGTTQQSRPSFGSWLTYGLGTENRNLPGFIVLCPGGYPVSGAKNWRSAFLPGAFQSTHFDTKYSEPDKLIANVRSHFGEQGAQRRQLDLLAKLNQAHG